MDNNTFKVLDYVKQNPNPDLELSLTSNMCPPNQALFDKFMDKVKALEESLVLPNEVTDVDLSLDFYRQEPQPDYRKIVIYVQDPKTVHTGKHGSSV